MIWNELNSVQYGFEQLNWKNSDPVEGSRSITYLCDKINKIIPTVISTAYYQGGHVHD